MRANILDRDALMVVSPTAISACARAAGWERRDPYRKDSHASIGEDRPEIIFPRTQRLGDYASVVAGIIHAFAQVAEQDELSVYRSLAAADRDVVRLQAGESLDGSVSIEAGVDLTAGARDMLLAAACSLAARGLTLRLHRDRKNSEIGPFARV